MRGAKESRTSSSPYRHRSRQHHLSPIQARSAGALQRAQDAGPGRLDARACGGTSPDGRQEEGEAHAGDIGERAGEIIEPFRLGVDGGDGHGGLQGECKADGGDEGGKERARELGCVQEGAENGHDCF